MLKHLSIIIGLSVPFADVAKADSLIFGFSNAETSHRTVQKSAGKKAERTARSRPDRVRPEAASILSWGRAPLLSIADRYDGRKNFTGFHGPWCAAAVGRWLEEAGYSRLASYRAIDYARYGHATTPHVGAVAVLRHHVGIVAGFDNRGVVLMSGNHAHHRVGYGSYPMRRIVAFREPV